MQMLELHDLAQSVGVPHHEEIMSEDQIIRAIQRACNHAACFRTGWRLDCKEVDCPWKQDCKRLVAAWMR